MPDPSDERTVLLSNLRKLHAGRRGLRDAPARPPGASDARSERLLHALEQMRAVTVETDSEGRNIYVSPSLISVLGYDPEQVVGRVGFDFVHDDDLEVLVALSGEVREGGPAATAQIRARHQQGHWIWLECTSSLFRTPEGETCTLTFARDVTALRQADEALRASEDRFRALASKASDLILELDSDGSLRYVSENFRHILGREPGELAGHKLGFGANVHPDDVPTLLEGFERIVGTDLRIGEREVRLLHADGSWRWFDSRFTTYLSSEGDWRALVIARDVSEQRRAQEELRETEERYRLIAETSGELIAEADSEGRIQFASPSARSVLGFEPEELEGTVVFDRIHPDDVKRCLTAFIDGLQTGEPVRFEPYRVSGKDGRWRWLATEGIAFRRADGTPRFLTVSRDRTDALRAETERRALEERIQHTQRLEGLGVMAGGIAHDFNNLLTPILGDAGLALMDLPEDSPVRARILKIQKAARRAATLTNQMLAYAGKGTLLEELVDMSALVREMSQLLETSLSRQASLELDLGALLPAVKGDTAQLTQVVMNLLTNAAEAVSEVGGRIAIRTGVVKSDEPARGRRIGDDLPPGQAVYFEVEDDGCGMDGETVPRIFDPFYTTKFTGRGLGLAAALGIVRAHGGAIEIETAPGRGTRFRVLFPAAGELPAAPEETRGDVDSWRSDARVLVVDDDEGVRDLVRATLERAGLRVLCAEDAAEGARLLRRNAGGVQLVILDRTMPTASGEEAFDTLQAAEPDVRILLMSGYSEESAAGSLAGRSLAGFLQKPFLPEDLLEKARRILER